MKWSIVFIFLAFIALISAESKIASVSKPDAKKTCPPGERYRVIVTKKQVDGKWVENSEEQCSKCKPGYELKKVNVHYRIASGVWKNKKDERCIKTPTKLPKCPENEEVVTVIRRHKLTKGWKVRMVSKCMKKCKKGFEAKHITVLYKKRGESNWKRKRARRCLPITPALRCKPGYNSVKRLVRSIFGNGKVRVKFTQKCERICHHGFTFEKVKVRTSKGVFTSSKCVPPQALTCIAPATSHRRLIRRKLPNGKFKIRYTERCLCPFGFRIKRSGKTYSCHEVGPKVTTTGGIINCPTGYKVKYSIKAVTRYINEELVARPEGKFSCVKNTGICKKGLVRKNVVVRTKGKAVKTSLCVPAHNPCPKGHKHKLHYKSVLMPSGTSFKSQLEFQHKCTNPCQKGFHVHKVKVKVNGAMSISRRCVPNLTLKCVSPAKLVRKMRRTKLKTGKFHVVYQERCVCPKYYDAYRRENRVVCKRRKVTVTSFGCPKGEKSRYEMHAVLKTLKNGKQVARPVGKLTCIKEGPCKNGFKKKTVSIHAHGAVRRTELCVPALNPCPNGYRHKFSYKAVVKSDKGKVTAVLRPTHKCILKPCKAGFKRERVGIRTSKKVSFQVRCVPKPTLVCKKPSKKYRKLTRTKLSNGKFRIKYVERCICPRKYRAVRHGNFVGCKSTKLPRNGEFNCPKGQKVRYVVRAVMRYVNGKKIARPAPQLMCVASSPCKVGHSSKFVTIRSRRSLHKAHICVPTKNCPKSHYQRLRLKAFIHKSGSPKIRAFHTCERKPCKNGFEWKKAKIISKRGTKLQFRCVPRRRLRCIGGVSIRRMVRRKQANGKVKVSYTEQCRCAKGTKTIKKGRRVECVTRPTRRGGKLNCPKGKKLKLVVVARTRVINGKVVAFPKPIMKCVNKNSCKVGFQFRKVTLRIHGKFVRHAKICVPRTKACAPGRRHKLHIHSIFSNGRPVLKKFMRCVSICKKGRTYQKVAVKTKRGRYVTFRCVPKPQLICKGGNHVRKVVRKKLSNGKYKSRYHEFCKCPSGLSAFSKGNYIECKKRKLTYLEKLKIKMRGQMKKAKLLQEQIDALKCNSATRVILNEIKAQILLKQKLIQKLEDK